MAAQNKECPRSSSLSRRINLSLVTVSWILSGQPTAQPALCFLPIAAASSGECNKTYFFTFSALQLLRGEKNS